MEFSSFGVTISDRWTTMRSGDIRNQQLTDWKRQMHVAPTTLSSYVAFEGGGAKGLVHVGALQALNDAKVDIIGTAGTSAGAIIAALVAAGYNGSDLFNPDTGRTVLQDVGLKCATDLFEPEQWKRIERFRNALHKAEKQPKRAFFELAHFDTVLVAAAICGGAGLGACLPWPVLCSATGAVIGIFFGIRLFYRRAKLYLNGLSTTEKVVTALNTLLLIKLRSNAGNCGATWEDPKDGFIRFRHMEIFGKPLRIVSTNLSTRQATMFSASTHPDVVVAKAVAASIALPIVFAPVVIDKVRYCDGGLVSNLPLWAFDEERRANLDVHTIGIQISDAGLVSGGAIDEGAGTRGAFSNLASAIRAAIFGADFLNKRQIDRLCECAIPAGIDLLEFDASQSKVMKLIADARASAKSVLIHRLIDAPRALDQFCEDTHDAVLEILKAACAQSPDEWDSARLKVRVAIFRMPVPTGLTIRMISCHNFAGHADQDIVLPINGSVTGKTLKEGIGDLYPVPFSNDVGLVGEGHQKIRSRVWPELQWLLTIPTSDGQLKLHERAVLAIDSNCKLDYIGAVVSDETFMNSLSDGFDKVIRDLRSIDFASGG